MITDDIYRDKRVDEKLQVVCYTAYSSFVNIQSFPTINANMVTDTWPVNTSPCSYITTEVRMESCESMEDGVM